MVLLEAGRRRLEGRVGTGGRSSVRVVSETESLLELLGGSIDGTLAVLSTVQQIGSVLNVGLEVSSSGDEIFQSHRLVSDRLVNNWCLVSLLMNGNDCRGA